MFNGAHLHLVLNHLPITGFCVTSVLALVAFFKVDLRRIAMMAVVVSGLLTLPAYMTGEPAEDLVKNHPELNISKDLIHNHEEAAQWAVSAGMLAGLLAAALLWLPMVTAVGFRRLYPLALLVCLWATSVMVVTGLQGGKIHHPEISAE